MIDDQENHNEEVLMIYHLSIDDLLAIANDREVEGDLLRSDLGQGVSFRPGTFDGAIR
jgi:hypothetical protein